MSWDKTIDALARLLSAMHPVLKYFGMWAVYALVGSILVLAGFGVGFNQSVLFVKEGTEYLAISVGFGFLTLATFLLRKKLIAMSRCDK